jgi:hypothetical protein
MESNGNRCEPREKHREEDNGNQPLLSQGKNNLINMQGMK